jgi:hypothetical protein
MAEETLTIKVSTAAQRLAVLSALAMAKELEESGQQAAWGEVLEVCEAKAVVRGRDLIRQTLEEVLQQQIQESEKKGG